MTFFKKKLWRAMLGLFLFLLLFSLSVASIKAADGINASNSAIKMLEDTAIQAKLVSQNASSAPTVYAIIGEIINVVLGFLGVVFLVLIIFGGILWMTAGGNEEKVKKSSTLMTQAAIGLAIVLFAFLITNFVIFRIIGLTTTP